jgi:hypothetical protein
MVTGLVGRLGYRSNPRYRGERRKYLDGDDGLRLWFHHSRSHPESAGDTVDGHVPQHVGCRLYWFVANLVDADRVPAVLANHGNAPAIVPVLMYVPQSYALSVADAEFIGTATTDLGCWVSHYSR